MKKILVTLLLTASAFAFASNLIKNPDFSAKNGRTWNLRKDYCAVKDNTLTITLKDKQTFHLFSERIVLDQKEKAPIYFGAEYKGFCKNKGWERAIILTELTYQDGTKEGWPKVLIGIPNESADWQKLDKVLNLPKPVKSFRYLILLKDETSAQFRNPYVRITAK